MSQTPPFKVFSGTNSRYLAEKICNSLGCELGQMNIQHFADGEFAVSFPQKGIRKIFGKIRTFLIFFSTQAEKTGNVLY